MGGGFFATMVGHLVCHHVILPTSSRGLAFFQWFYLLPPPSWDVGLWSLMHLSLVSNEVITLLFLMPWYVKTNTFPLPIGNVRYSNFIAPNGPFSSPLFLKLNYGTFSSLIGFFNKLFTWVKVYHIYSRYSFECYTNMFLILCMSNHRRLVIISSYHTCILFVFNSFPYDIINSP